MRNTIHKETLRNNTEYKFEQIPKGMFNAYIKDIYDSKNGIDWFEFGFHWTGSYYEIDILQMPSYGTASTDLHDTHRLPSDRGGYKICFGDPYIISSMSAARKWAGIWSECTVSYINKGEAFPNS